jgi:hypothetical protein
MSGTRRKPGGLGPQVEGYQAWLLQRGYTSSTLRNMLKELGQVGRWRQTLGRSHGRHRAVLMTVTGQVS